MEEEKIKIKVYGARRSGTSYLVRLLDDNCTKTYNGIKGGAWKHGVETTGPHVQPVAVVRHPLSWLPSVYGALKDLGRLPEWMPFNTWIRSHPILIADAAPDGWEHGPDQTPFANTWSFKYGYWLRKQIPIVRYEDILFWPRRACSWIANKLGLGRVGENFEVPDDYVAAAGEEKSEWDREKILTRQREAVFMEEWEEDMVDKLRSDLDMKIMRRFGYTLDSEGPSEMEKIWGPGRWSD